MEHPEVGSLLGVDDHMVWSVHSCMDRSAAEGSPDDNHHNQHHDELVDSHPRVVHGLLAGNGHSVHDHHNSHGVAVNGHGIVHHVVDCIHVVVHGGRSHLLGMADGLGSEIELVNHEVLQAGSR